MNKGIIFNIQRYSLHDGPGIRTTVFFKGCPLSCKWCANPESQLHDIQILHDESKCTYCKTCITTCPKHAISIINEHISIQDAQCIGCLSCVQQCPNRALQVEGSYKSIDEVVKQCLKDKDFYEESGGGVTISGGEGMAQPAFLKDLIMELKKHNIHTAIETTGYVSKDVFQSLAPLFDLLLFDVKHYDTNRHVEGCGVHNETIINNLLWAIQHQIFVLPRIPIIPGFNASLEEANGFAKFFKTNHIKRVQLLPFHQFGETKYELLHRTYAYEHVNALYPEDLKDYQSIFLKEGIDCFF